MYIYYGVGGEQDTLALRSRVTVATRGSIPLETTRVYPTSTVTDEVPYVFRSSHHLALACCRRVGNDVWVRGIKCVYNSRLTNIQERLQDFVCLEHSLGKERVVSKKGGGVGEKKAACVVQTKAEEQRKRVGTGVPSWLMTSISSNEVKNAFGNVFLLKRSIKENTVWCHPEDATSRNYGIHSCFFSAPPASSMGHA